MHIVLAALLTFLISNTATHAADVDTKCVTARSQTIYCFTGKKQPLRFFIHPQEKNMNYPANKLLVCFQNQLAHKYKFYNIQNKPKACVEYDNNNMCTDGTNIYKTSKLTSLKSKIWLRISQSQDIPEAFILKTESNGCLIDTIYDQYGFGVQCTYTDPEYGTAQISILNNYCNLFTYMTPDMPTIFNMHQEKTTCFETPLTWILCCTKRIRQKMKPRMYKNSGSSLSLASSNSASQSSLLSNSTSAELPAYLQLHRDVYYPLSTVTNTSSPDPAKDDIRIETLTNSSSSLSSSNSLDSLTTSNISTTPSNSTLILEGQDTEEDEDWVSLPDNGTNTK